MAKLINKGRIADAVKKAKTKYEVAHEVAQKNAALPIERGGLGLPPDNTAMDRARAMGMTERVYRGGFSDITDASIEASKGHPSNVLGRAFYSTTSPEDASKHYATKDYDAGARVEASIKEMHNDAVDRGEQPLSYADYKKIVLDKNLDDNSGVVYPLLANKKKFLNMTEGDADYLGADEMEDIIKGIEKQFGEELPEIRDIFQYELDNGIDISADRIVSDLIPNMPNLVEKKNGPDMSSEYLRKSLMDIGYKGAIHNSEIFGNMPVDGGASHVISFSGEGIRSTNAAFDPLKRNSPDLLASVGAGTVAGAGLLATPDEAEAGVVGKSIGELAEGIKQIKGVKTLNLYETSNGDIKLDTLIIDKEQRKQGIGSNVMQQINDYADANNKRVILTPAVKDDFQGTTSRNRLVNYYKRHGFYENKGRKKDFSISEGMIREPNKGASSPAYLAGVAGVTAAGTALTTKQKAERARLSRMTRKQQLADVTKRALSGLTEIPGDLAKYAHDVANFGAGIFSTADLLGGAAAIPYEMTGSLEAYQRDVQPYVQQANETQSAGFRKLEDMAGKVIETAITATAPAWYPAYQQWSPIIGNAMEDFYYPNADKYDR